MKNFIFTYKILFFSVIFSACGNSVVLNSDNGIVKFAFDSEPIIGSDYVFSIMPTSQVNTFIIQNNDSLPLNTDVSALKAKFSTINTLVKVKVAGIEQISGVSINDFSKTIICDSYAENADVQHYKVILNIAKVPRQTKYIVISTEEISDAVFSTIATRLKNNETAKVKVGISAMINYLSAAPVIVLARLNNLLALADKYNLPVMVEFDGIDWQQGYPELWNWFDPSMPGYNPDNVNNVEWTSWNNTDAVKLGWRNWGNQIRIQPMPNLASPAYRNACYTKLRVLRPIVL